MNVVGLADFIENRTSLGLARAPTGFTLRDRADLEAWAKDDREVELCSSETGAFAMLYRTGMPYSSWGVERQGRGVLLWDSVSHADIGIFPNMTAALAAVPVADTLVPTENVILFAAARARARHATA